MQIRKSLLALLLVGSAAYTVATPATGDLSPLLVEETDSKPKNGKPVNKASAEESNSAPLQVLGGATRADTADVTEIEAALQPVQTEQQSTPQDVQEKLNADISNLIGSGASKGRMLVLFGIVLLITGVSLSLAGNKKSKVTRTAQTSFETTVQQSIELMDKLGVKSASKMAFGCIFAGLIELARSLRANQNGQTGSKAPTLKGRLTLLFGVIAMLVTMSGAGVDLSTLNVSELIKILGEYLSKTHLGLFAAGGATLLKSMYDTMAYQQQQKQLQQADSDTPASESEVPGTADKPQAAAPVDETVNAESTAPSENDTAGQADAANLPEEEATGEAAPTGTPEAQEENPAAR
ncbi:hypothetical protein, conserved [Eimeria necatrix]|uniref:Uncharacterized protein n=1 Tax=Eimeria necatrix TaxID=51315 RepID=U6MQ55_9EIME|nr:hypothetical protein, conserved [Eimeria necatrix]CDJ65213.1 hypothetical protein, conserved [Eimeria necatrix]